MARRKFVSKLFQDFFDFKWSRVNPHLVYHPYTISRNKNEMERKYCGYDNLIFTLVFSKLDYLIPL